jgi:hypothetical protein
MEVQLDRGCLVCPSCGGDNLHHDRVDVYWREHEDAPSSLAKINAVSGAEMDRGGPFENRHEIYGVAVSEGNPSARRHGVRIWFECELCDADVFMNIAQHKGLTMVDCGFIQNGRHSEKR